MVIDLKRVFATFALPRTGVVHVGAHFGDEIETYEHLGFQKVLFVEANPEVFEVLSQRMAGKAFVMLECIAVTDRLGSTSFNITDNDGQSSSVLALKKHRALHPQVMQTKTITVNTTTVDRLLEKYPTVDFSFLSIDIQGAELLAFKGAAQLLDRISAINCEVNFDELYDGAPHVSILDSYLSAFSFTRIETTSPTRSWGDALYVKDRFTKI